MSLHRSMSKDERLYRHVSSGNISVVKLLRREGAGLEWRDKEGKTPLILASINPQIYDVAKTLLELGANVNYYRPGGHSGTALHHAAKRGLEQMVKLLLSHGASALVKNDNSQTALDVARLEGYTNIVRAIENHVCLFSGWLQARSIVSGYHRPRPRKVWVVILRCGARKLTKHFKLELAIYSGLEDAKPLLNFPLWKADINEPNFFKPYPFVAISVSNKLSIELAPINQDEKQQLRRCCNACKNIPQIVPTALSNPIAPSTVPSAPRNLDMVDDCRVHDPAIDSSHLEKEKENSNSSTCVICYDAPIEGACIPCGHMAGCMSCLTEVKGRNLRCPVCRTKVDQVVRLYAV